MIVHEFARNRVSAASASVSSGGVVTLNGRNFSYFSLRSATLFLIAGLHGALFYGMITTLSHTRASTPPPRLVNRVIEPVPRTREPPSKAAMEGWTLTVPKPDTVIPPLPPIESDVRADYDVKPIVRDVSPPSTDTPPHIVSLVAGGPGTGFPETSDYYPAPDIRAGNEGVSTVRVCVDPTGRLTSGPTMEKSSGFARLDEGALRLARAGSGHYRANTEDGQPVNSCYPFIIRFQLRK